MSCHHFGFDSLNITVPKCVPRLASLLDSRENFISLPSSIICRTLAMYTDKKPNAFIPKQPLSLRLMFCAFWLFSHTCVNRLLVIRVSDEHAAFASDVTCSAFSALRILVHFSLASFPSYCCRRRQRRCRPATTLDLPLVEATDRPERAQTDEAGV